MRPKMTVVFVCLGLMFGFGRSLAQSPAQPGAVASLPLEEVLRLYRQADRPSHIHAPVAPVSATVDRMELRGRLLDAALDIRGTFQISILNDGAWVRVPLIQLGAGSHLAEVPRLPRGVLLVEEGSLWLLTREQGHYDFDLAWVEDAKIKGETRQAQLKLAPATVARLTVQHDAGLFSLKPGFVSVGAEGAVYYPKAGRLEVGWARSAASAERSEQAVVAERPQLEPVVRRADVSVVATLQGRRIVRAKYELSFAGNQQILCDLPEGLILRRVHLNGLPVAFEVEKGRVTLQVAPRRAGDETAKLELLLDGQGEGFLLSGRKHFVLPSLSWGINQVQVSLHMPRVFNYRWSGGSLVPATDLGEVQYAHRIPTPGKSLGFRQQLVQGAPDLLLDYTVDLAGNYFDGLNPRRQSLTPVKSTQAVAAQPVEAAQVSAVSAQTQSQAAARTSVKTSGWVSD